MPPLPVNSSRISSSTSVHRIAERPLPLAERLAPTALRRGQAGELIVVFQARKMKVKGGVHSWRLGFTHPLSAFQAFCILLALNMGDTEEPAPQEAAIGPTNRK